MLSPLLIISSSFDIAVKNGASIPGFLADLAPKSQNILNIIIGLFVGVCCLMVVSKILFKIFDFLAIKHLELSKLPPEPQSSQREHNIRIPPQPYSQYYSVEDQTENRQKHPAT